MNARDTRAAGFFRRGDRTVSFIERERIASRSVFAGAKEFLDRRISPLGEPLTSVRGRRPIARRETI